MGAVGLYGFDSGGSINMISIFAVLMATGIVIDDAIVVGEESYLLWKDKKLSPFDANMKASRKPSLVVASITTITAFAPLFTMPGSVGIIFRDIPLLMILIISISIIDCLFIMPHHLYKAYQHSGGQYYYAIEATCRKKMEWAKK